MQVLAAMFALACGSTEPTRSTPGTLEHIDSPDAEAGSDEKEIAPSDADANLPSAPDSSLDATATTKAGSRVVGYLPVYHSLEVSGVPLDTLTHLNLAFAQPTSDGRVDFDADKLAQVTTLISAAHEKNVKVLGSIGGADASRVEAALQKSSDAFVRETVAFLKRHDLDGIDIDIEGPQINPVTYGELVNGLVAHLPAGKLLTAAVKNYLPERYSALDKVNFLNVMSYDTWCPPEENNGKCEHSTFAQAKRELEFWSTEYFAEPGRGVFDPANLVLGVPFYAHCWGPVCNEMATETWDDPTRPTYAQVQKHWKTSNPGKPVPDLISDDASGDYVSLNGPETIESKALLAKAYGGIMIWDLGQDAPGEDSLFSAIKKTR
jgi:chitinase